jgi:hypothetical protein
MACPPRALPTDIPHQVRSLTSAGFPAAEDNHVFENKTLVRPDQEE